MDRFIDNVSVRRTILKNNIYGVDLNDESVEITKLSMFLKVAQKDSKLPDLNKNIKCGNSLIANSEYAGKKAFNWQTAFPEIDKFDVVIGNHPYINVSKLNKRKESFFMEQYESAAKRFDIYIGFIEKGD